MYNISILKKNWFLVLLLIAIISSCSQPSDVVTDYVASLNRYDEKGILKYINDSTKFVRGKGEWATKEKIINNLDSSRENYIKTTILAIQQDSLNKNVFHTREKYSSLFDSLLEVKSQMVLNKSYETKGNTIKLVSIDSVRNEKEYKNELLDKAEGFFLYLQENAKGLSKDEIQPKLLDYLRSYSSLEVNEKRNYSIASQIIGTYICKNSIYQKLEFKGRTTVVVYDGFFGLPFPTSYVIDGEYVRINTDKSDLLFRIKDKRTLIGEGWAKGVFKKKS